MMNDVNSRARFAAEANHQFNRFVFRFTRDANAERFDNRLDFCLLIVAAAFSIGSASSA